VLHDLSFSILSWKTVYSIHRFPGTCIDKVVTSKDKNS